jgi:hypothetical protein
MELDQVSASSPAVLFYRNKAAAADTSNSPATLSGAIDVIVVEQENGSHSDDSPTYRV